MTSPMTVLGVDIGYSETKRTTGVCLLEWDATTIRWSLERVPTDVHERTVALGRLLSGKVLEAAGLDAPFRGGLDEIGVYRDAELMLTRGLQPFIGKPGQASSGNGRALNRSANEAARLLLELSVLQDAVHDARVHAKCLAEAFPTTFLGVLLPQDSIPSAGARSDVFYEQLLGPATPRPKPLGSNVLHELLLRLLPGRRIAADLARIVDHEDRASFICALTAACVALRRYVAVGDPGNGYIILPPRATATQPGLQDWAWNIIQANRPRGSERAVLVE